jgi:hypothetical protein
VGWWIGRQGGFGMGRALEGVLDGGYLLFCMAPPTKHPPFTSNQPATMPGISLGYCSGSNLVDRKHATTGTLP